MKVVKKSFAQNYLIQNPFVGTLILTLFFWAFALLYKPFEFDYNTKFNFTLSLFLLCLSGSLTGLGFIYLTKLFFPTYFNKNSWTITREIIIILIALLIMGITVYAFGYLINTKQPPVRLSGILDAVKMTFLIGLIPFAFFTIKNIGNPHITTQDVLNENADPNLSIIEIQSALKEKLQISVDNLIYVVSSGNYVDFYLTDNNNIIKKTLRNSLNDIEKQLIDFPNCVRTHRAFMVNMDFIQSKKGNTLGYRLKLKKSDEEVPVSRKMVPSFDKAFENFTK